MTTKPFSIRALAAALTLCAVSGTTLPAHAACEFDVASASVDLSPAGATDPYAANFTIFASIAIDEDCGIVWFDYDRDHDLSGGGGATVPVDVQATTGSNAPGSSRREIDEDATGIALRIDVGLQDNGVPLSGTYTETDTLTLFDAPTGGNRIGAPITLSFSLTVDQIMTLSLNGGGIASGSRIDLGIFEERTTRSGIDPGLNLTAVSNDPYRIEIDSMNGWRIVNDADVRYAIPYGLKIDGQTVTGNPGSVGALGATDGDGTNRPLTFDVTPGDRLRAGTYEDEVTITIFGQD